MESLYPTRYLIDQDSFYSRTWEIIFGALYIVVLIVLPQFLEVNRMNPSLVCLPVIPISLLLKGSSHSSFLFNPCIHYTFWLTRHGSAWTILSKILNKIIVLMPFLGDILGAEADPTLVPGDMPLPVGHILTPIIAAILAGIICNYFFPDDSTSWLRKL